MRLPRCQHGCPLTVVQTEGGLEAVCLEHPEEDPIPIEKDDLNRYAFSVDMLLVQLRTANRIEGNLDSQTFELPIEKLVSGLLKPKAITELSKRQKTDYEKFEYQCYDKVYIPCTIPMKRSNLIMVNGNEYLHPGVRGGNY